MEPGHSPAPKENTEIVILNHQPVRGSQLFEVEISVKREDCSVSNALSRFRLRGSLINLNIGVDESSHLIETGNNYKDIMTKLKMEGVKVSPITRDKMVALSPSCTSSRCLARLNSVVLSARTPQKDLVIYRLLTDKKTLKRILGEFAREGIEHSVLDETPYVSLSGLTSRQSEIVAYALLNGYFDVRRRISLTSIADNFSIKASTTDLILRRALKKIVEAQVMRKI